MVVARNGAVADAVQVHSERRKEVSKRYDQADGRHKTWERLFKRPEERIERLLVEAKPKNAKYPQRARRLQRLVSKICREELAKRDADEDCVEDI